MPKPNRWRLQVPEVGPAILQFTIPASRPKVHYSPGARGWHIWIPAWADRLVSALHGERISHVRVSVLEDGRILLEPLTRDEDWPLRRMKVFQEGRKLFILVGEEEET